MPRPRVIPILLFNGEGLVKSESFARHVYIGDPLNTLRIFNEKEADEIVVLDISATREGRGPDFGRLRDWAGECFMPLTYGGGISTLEQAESCLRAGIEKVAINSAGVRDPGLLSAISRHVGCQSVVAAVDVRRDRQGRVRVVVDGARRMLDVPLRDHLCRMRDAGAGEIMLQDADRDGSAKGYDLELFAEAVRAVDVPVIAAGGAGSLADLGRVLSVGASAAGAGRLFCLYGRFRAVLITYPEPAEIEAFRATANVV